MLVDHSDEPAIVGHKRMHLAGELPMRFLLAALPLFYVCLFPERAAAQTATGANASQLTGGTSVNLGILPITAAALNPDGSTPASGGMYVPAPTFGPFGSTPAKDIPFSTNSIPQQLLQDQQAHSAADALKNDPSVRALPTVNQFTQNYIIRGFQVGPLNGIYQDGLDLLGYATPAVEADSRIDIVKGAASILYGFAPPAGIVNYISKLPLDGSLTQVDLGYISRGTVDEGFDVSRRFGPGGQFGIRGTVYQQNGSTSVDDQSSDRNVQSLALDWRPTRDLRVWGVVEHDGFRLTGSQTAFFLASPLYALPNAPNPRRLYGQPWDFNYVDTLRTEGGLNYSHDGWTVNAAVGYATTYNSYAGNFASVGLQSNGTFDSNLTQGYSHAYSLAYRAQLSKEFTTGLVTQTISLIADGSDHIFHYNVLSPIALGASSLSNPVYAAQPNLPRPAPSQHNNIRLESEILSDKVDITRYVTLFVGGVRSAISNGAYLLPSHTFYTNIYQNKITPIAALEVKPTANLTFYTSYIQALQPGSTAPNTAVNANQTLPPFVGDQYEVGVKAQVTPGLEVNAALFHIDQAYAYLSNSNVFTEDGTQTNQGFEVTAVGRVLPSLTVFSGFTFVDAKVSNATGSLNGNSALLVSNYRLSAYAEYDVPRVPGLTLLGGAYYTSRTPVQQNSSANIARGYPATIFAPGYVTFDVGAKYATKLGSTPVVVRAYLQNALNERYWIVYGNPVEPGPPLTGKLTLSAFF